MTLRAKGTISLAVLAILAVVGCEQVPPWDSVVPAGELVRDYNSNASGVPRLWARAKIAAVITDSQGRSFAWGSVSPLASPNGLLLLAKDAARSDRPDFALVGREAGVELFRVGESSLDGTYYLWYHLGDQGAAWWGRQNLAGAPGIKELPIDPNQLVAVLGVTELPSDPTKLPAVGVTMSDNPPAYVVTYVDRQNITGRILFQREMYFRWSLKEPRRPFQVNLLDDRGRRVMVARLKDYRPIATPGVEPAQPPVMPTDIEISWPQKKSSIHIVLSDMTTADKWDRDACRFLDNLPRGIPMDRITQVDAGVKAPEARP